MTSMTEILNLTAPTTPPLDSHFCPPILVHRRYKTLVEASRKGEKLVIGLERNNKLVSRYEMTVLTSPEALPVTLHIAERAVKFMLWARGGWKIYIAGPKVIGDHIKRIYSKKGTRQFDVNLMSDIYGKPFQVILTTHAKVPAGKELKLKMGGHWDGCRIGFDLGASDYKVAAVQNGEAVYSDEFPWDPKNQPDPEYHYHHIMSALHRAAAHLSRVDAIGGSTAGVVVNNQMRVASLFRAVPKKIFGKQVSPLFERIRRAWGVPLWTMNDGDVTALAGALSLETQAMLGMAMGSSLAAGFLDGKGCITGWLNELAFVPADFNPQAAVDEWSGDVGVGVQYFSQQAVNKLLPVAGLSFPADMGLPERLKEVQKLMAQGNAAASKIYETIGVYLGYTLPYYAEFYDYRNVLILGRVTTGKGGDIVIAKAKEILTREFQDVKISLHVPDEKSRRVGQAVAAASIPAKK